MASPVGKLFTTPVGYIGWAEHYNKGINQSVYLAKTTNSQVNFLHETYIYIYIYIYIYTTLNKPNYRYNFSLETRTFVCDYITNAQESAKNTVILVTSQ